MSTTTYVFMENHRKLSFNYYQIPSLSGLLLIPCYHVCVDSFLHWVIQWVREELVALLFRYYLFVCLCWGFTP